MEHISTIVNFKGVKKTARVEYFYEGPFEKLVVSVYVNNKILHVFENVSYIMRLPSKTGAKRFIAMATKEAKKPAAKTRKVLIEKVKKV